MDSSLKFVFVEALLGCWLAMAFSSSNCVCAVQRAVPKPGRASSDAGSSSGAGAPRLFTISLVPLDCVVAVLEPLPLPSPGRAVYILHIQAARLKDVLSYSISFRCIILPSI